MKQIETSKYFKLPDPKIFWDTDDRAGGDKSRDKESRKERDELEQAVPFYAIEYTVSPVSDTLTGRIASITCKQVIEQGSADTADMQRTRR